MNTTQAEKFLDKGLADVQDEGGVNTYYSEGAVLECIAAALASRSEAPTLKMLEEMAYLLKLVPRGDNVPVQFLDVLQKQFLAAMTVAQGK